MTLRKTLEETIGFMARQSQFETVKLYKDMILGIGAYGKVCKAKCDGLNCAAKIIHETLFSGQPDTQQNSVMRRFRKEIAFLSTISHPNIVQHIGVSQDPDTKSPVLLMELLDTNLTCLLDRQSGSMLPYHIQVNICHDIVLALRFLHHNGIIHRDLSSNNILLVNANKKAKVSDFGMARLHDSEITFPGQGNILTKMPGTDVYMPPEAAKNKPDYTKTIDCFSFGVLVIQILTTLYPEPGDRRKELRIDHPEAPKGVAEVQIEEKERRKDHICMIDPNNPLLSIALKCIIDEPCERPSALNMCESLESLKGTAVYSESERTVTDNISKQLQDRLDQQEQRHEMEVRNLKQIIRSLSCDLGKETIQECKKSPQLDYSMMEGVYDEIPVKENQKLKESQIVDAKVKRSKHEIKKAPNDSSQPLIQNASKAGINFNFNWFEGTGAPCEMSRYSNAVFKGETVYLVPYDSREIYSYETNNHKWLLHASCAYLGSSLALVNNHLTTIGGKRTDMGYRYPINTTAGYQSSFTNKLLSLTKKASESDPWTENLPSMPTRRAFATALNTNTNIIVAGGVGGVVLTTVEVLNFETLQWMSAPDLPQQMWAATAALCGDKIFVLGGFDGNSRDLFTAFTCSLETLLHSCQSKTLASRVTSVFSLSKPTSSVWRGLVDVPLSQSTCASVHGHLLAVGGRDSNGRPTTDIHVYNQITDSWTVVNYTHTATYLCFTAVNPSSKLVIIGGRTCEETATNEVHIAEIFIR